MAKQNEVILQAKAEVAAAKKRIEELTAAVNALATATGAVKDKSFDFESTKAINQLKALNTELEKFAKSAESVYARSTKASAKSADAAERAAAKEEAAAIKKAQAQERAVVREGVALAKKNAALDRSIQKTNEAARNAEIAADRQAKAAERAAARIREKAKAEEDAAAKANTLASRVTTAATAIQAFFASIVVSKLKDFVGAILEAASAMDSYTATLQAAVGGTDAAAEEIDRLREVANTFGVDFEILLQRFGRFKIAADSVGFSAEKTRAIFDGFVAVSRALGNTNTQTERTFVALEQIMSKGVVQSEELKQQLGDSLVGAYNNLGKAIGKTGVEFEKMLKENQILAKQAIPQLLEEFLKLTGSSIQKNLNSVNAELARTRNALFDAKVIIAEEARPELVEMLQTLRAIGKDGAISFENIGQSLGLVVSQVSGLIQQLDSLLSLRFDDILTRGLANIVHGFELVTAAGAKMGAGLVYWIERARGKTDEQAEASKQAAQKIGDAQVAAITRLREGLEESTVASQRAAAARVEAEADAAKRIRELHETVAAAAAEARAEQAKAEGELTKAQISELKKREQAFESFFAKIADLAEKSPDFALPDAPTGGGGGNFVADDDVQKITAVDERIRKLTEAIQALEEEKKQLNEDPYVTGGQLQRVDEIDQKIRGLQGTLQRTREVVANNELAKALDDQASAAVKAEAAMKRYSEQVQAALVDLVRDNDAFRESFAALDADGQAAIQSLVGSFESLSQAGTLTQSDFAAFLSGMATIFAQAGVIGEQFAAQLQAGFGGTATSATELLASFAALSEAQTLAAAQATTNAATVVAAEETKKAAFFETGAVFIQSQLEQDAKLAESIEKQKVGAVELLTGVAESSKALQDQVATGAAVMLDATGKAAGEAVAAVTTTVNETTTVITSASEEVKVVLSDMAQAVADTSDGAVASITNTMDEAQETAGEFGDVVVEVGEDGSISVRNIGTAAKETATDVGNAVVAIEDAQGKIVGLQTDIANSGDAAKEAFDGAKDAAEGTVQPVEKVGKALHGVKTSSEGMAKAAQETGKAYDGLDRSLEKVPTALEKATEAQKAWNAELLISKGLAAELRDIINSIDI